MLSHLPDLSSKMRITQLHNASFSWFSEERHKKRFLILQLYHHVDILVEFECLSQVSFLWQPLFLSSLEFSWFALCACNCNTVLPHTWDYFGVKSLSPRVYPWRTHLKHQECETLMVVDCNNYPYVPRNRNHAYFVCEYYKVVHHQD